MTPVHLSTMWSAIAPGLGNHLWQSTLFAVVAALLAVVLRKNQARARYWLWTAASVKFLAPFSLLIAIGTVLLTLAYKLVPARQVPLRAAFIGGLLAAVAFEGAKFGFAFYITHVRTYQIVYGALAALPLFLIWIYVCWIILLVGAAVAATLAEHRWGRSRKRRRP